MGKKRWLDVAWVAFVSVFVPFAFLTSSRSEAIYWVGVGIWMGSLFGYFVILLGWRDA